MCFFPRLRPDFTPYRASLILNMTICGTDAREGVRAWGGREKKRAAVPLLRELYRIAAFTGRRWDANAHWRILEPAEPKRSACCPTQGGHSAVSQGSASVNQGEGGDRISPPHSLSSLSLSRSLCVRVSSAHTRPALRSADTPGGQCALDSPCHWTICGYRARPAPIYGDTLVERESYDLLHPKKTGK